MIIASENFAVNFLFSEENTSHPRSMGMLLVEGSSCGYLRNEKNFSKFFFHVLNLASIFNFFKKKMNHITDGFLN